MKTIIECWAMLNDDGKVALQGYANDLTDIDRYSSNKMNDNDTYSAVGVVLEFAKNKQKD